MPPRPGVYIFKDNSGTIIYVGKAKNLHHRVANYFQPPVRLGPKTSAMVSKAKTVEYIEVASELEALLLESRLIKKFRPFYNLASKDDKSPYYIHISKEEFPRPVINHLSQNAVAGPFLNRHIPTRILSGFRRVTPFCQAKRPVRRPCLYSHLGLCHPCPGAINSSAQRQNYQQHITQLRRLLKGQFSSVHRALSAEMRLASKLQDYEQASKTRNQLQALALLLATPVTPDEYLVNPNLTQDLRLAAVSSLTTALHLSKIHRIEMFDNAHLSGFQATSAMAVAVDGEILPRLYRHFTIKDNAANSDTAMMREVITRRLKHTDWPTPDLIVLDGGKPQLSAVRTYTHLPLISLAKRRETIIFPVGDGFKEIQLPKSHPGLQLLMHLRDEAHRFSRRLHHQHRRKNFRT